MILISNSASSLLAGLMAELTRPNHDTEQVVDQATIGDSPCNQGTRAGSAKVRRASGYRVRPGATIDILSRQIDGHRAVERAIAERRC